MSFPQCQIHLCYQTFTCFVQYHKIEQNEDFRSQSLQIYKFFYDQNIKIQRSERKLAMSNEVIIRKSTQNFLSLDSPCTVIFAGNTVQVSTYLHSPVDPERKASSAPRCTRNTERRTDDKPFVRSLTAFHSLVPFINSNFLASPSEIHLVLTYYPQTFNAYQPTRDFKPFWKKVLYRYPDYRYISVLEPHANGAWHLHVLLRSFSESPQLIDLKRLQQLWPHGDTYA